MVNGGTQDHLSVRCVQISLTACRDSVLTLNESTRSNHITALIVSDCISD